MTKRSSRARSLTWYVALLCVAVMPATIRRADAAQGWINSQTLCSVEARTNSGGGYFIKPCATYASRNGCAQGGWLVWHPEDATDQARTMMALAMMALTTGFQVDIWTDGTCTAEGFDHVTWLLVKK